MDSLTADASSSKVDKTKMMPAGSATSIDVRELNRVVCVMTHLKSGSGLMSSLLDDHPNLISLPDDILMGFQEFWDSHHHLAPAELIAAFNVYYAVIFDARDTCDSPRLGSNIGDLLNWENLGDDRNECLQVDREWFERRMTELIGQDSPVSRKLFFQAVHLAYAEAQGRDIKDPVIVFGLHITHTWLVESFLEDFPDALFLQMIRHPIWGTGSHFRGLHSTGYMDPTVGFGTMYWALYCGIPYPAENRERWLGVKLEDVHLKPRQTMQALADWIGIPWNESLLQSTLNGKKWWNDKKGIQVNGFNNVD